MAGAVIGWKLDHAERERLLDMLPPRWPDVVADHVTLSADPDGAPLPAETCGEIVGEAGDGKGIQALVVRIGGTSRRPDGGRYHITWSLDRSAGRRAVESNELIAARGWRPLAKPIRIALIPARFG